MINLLIIDDLCVTGSCIRTLPQLVHGQRLLHLRGELPPLCDRPVRRPHPRRNGTQQRVFDVLQLL